MKKKGISPLIATVILISIAVALGVIVLDWGRGYIKDTTKYAKENYETSVACKMDVLLDVVRIDGADQICYVKNSSDNRFTVDMILENKGRIDVFGVEITAISMEKRLNVSSMTDLNIKQANPYKLNITYNMLFENLSIIRIAPIISAEDGYLLCNNRVLEVNGVEVVPCEILG